MTQSDAFGSAFNKARNICHNESVGTVQVNHSQIRVQCGEMVVGDLRVCIGDTGKQCGFPDIGESDQPHIRDHLQLKLDLQLLCRLSRLRVFGHLHGRCGEVLVAKAAFSAL